METLFPQILFLGPMFAPLVLRIAAAIIFALWAHVLYKNRAALAAGPFPLIGKPGTIVAWLAIAITALLALALAAGFETQIAAIIGFLAGIKGWIFAKRYMTFYPSGRTAYFLLAVVCLTLIATGAGAFAIDKPY